MKLGILILILIVIAMFSLKGLYSIFKGRTGCSCGQDKKSCNQRECNH